MRVVSMIAGGALVALALALIGGAVVSAKEIGRGVGEAPISLAAVGVAPIPKAVAASPEAPAPEPVALAVAEPRPPAPKALAAPVARPVPPKLANDAGSLNLKADFPAEIYVDGKKVGNTLVRSYRVNPGVHKVRFDCNTDGRKVKGTPKVVRVDPFADVDVKHECPMVAKLRD